MPTPIPEKSNFVAIGDWNPAIIQPKWLKEQFSRLVPDDVPLIFTTVGGTPSVVLDLGAFLLDPNGGRVIVTPKTSDEDTWSLISELMSGISKKLEHTPISAAGCNFTYRLDEGEKFEIEESKYSNDANEYTKMELTNCIERTIQRTFSFEDYNINLAFLSSEKEQILRINYHYQSPIDAIVVALNRLLENYRGALELCSKLIGSES
jgi:hypothetical protein